jgi:SAM-dependent methyltransferase
MSKIINEADEVVKRYAERARSVEKNRYSMLNPDISHTVFEKQITLLRLLATYQSRPLNDLKVIEVGCGTGNNLLELLRIGFHPSNLVGNELLPERIALARLYIPEATQIMPGDALLLDINEHSFDIVYQSTVFTSLLDDHFQEMLAKKMWSWVKPGGSVLWYDFIYNNPRNKDVKGIPLSRIQKLFPEGKIHFKKITLAPPISRQVCKFHPSLYTFFNAFPFLRTHLLCWIQKK